MSNGKNAHKKLSGKESKTVILTTPQYSAISEHSSLKGTPEDIEVWLMSCQEDSLASPSQSPESKPGKTMKETCGHQLATLSKLSGQDTSFWKMSQGLFHVDISETFLKIFPKSGMTRDGKLYPLPKQGVATNGTGCGLWRTPGASDSDGRNPYKSEEKLLARIKKGKQLNLENQVAFPVTWPTPTTMDHAKRKGMRPSRAATGRKTGYLSEMVQQWPTTTKCGNYNRKGASETSGDGLATKVKRDETSWPTPNCSNSTGADSHGTGGDNLQTAVNFPTPTNSMMTLGDMEQAKFAGNGGKRPSYDVANTFPTPSTREWKGGRKPETLKSKGRTENNTLNDKVNFLEGKTGQLNADWVEWLMSWPIGWTSLEPLTELIWLDPGVDPHPVIPRVTTGQKNRTNRLKAIGNGQFPPCVAAAWKVLSSK